MSQLVTMNVSVEQIERDLRAGKSVGEIAQDWSEPPANVYAVQRAMDAAAAGPPPVPPARAASAVHNPPPARVPPTSDAGVTALVVQASQSKHARTRNLGAKLDLLVEELCGRLDAEHAEAAQQEAKRKERAAAAAEVARLEEQLRAARAKLGGRATAPVNRSKTGSAGGKSTRPVYEGGPTTAEIRTWAASAGVDHPTHGTLPKRVIDAYRAAHGDGA